MKIWRGTDVYIAFLFYQLVLIYTDNIYVCSKSPVDHIERIMRALQLIQGAGVNVTGKEWSLIFDTGDPLADVIWTDHPEPLGNTLKALPKHEDLTNQA